MLSNKAEELLRLLELSGGDLSIVGTFGEPHSIQVGAKLLGAQVPAERRQYADAAEELSDAAYVSQVAPMTFGLTRQGRILRQYLAEEQQAGAAVPDGCTLGIGDAEYKVTYLGNHKVLSSANTTEEFDVHSTGWQVPGVTKPRLGHPGCFSITHGAQDYLAVVGATLDSLPCFEGRQRVTSGELDLFFKRPGLVAVRDWLLAGMPGKPPFVLTHPVRKWVDEGREVPKDLIQLVDKLDDLPKRILADCERDALALLVEAREERRPDGTSAVDIARWARKRRFYRIRDHIRATLEDLRAKGLVRTDDGVRYEVEVKRLPDVRRVIAGLPSDQLYDAQPPANLPAYVPKSTGEFDAFLCHASEDKEAIVAPFAEAVRQAGMMPWLDKAEMGWGDNLVAKVQQGLARSKYVVVFLSDAFLKKPWPDTELKAALSMEIEGRSLVLPILLGISHEDLQARCPLVSPKLYRSVAPYSPQVPVAPAIIDDLVQALRDRLRRDS